MNKWNRLLISWLVMIQASPGHTTDNAFSLFEEAEVAIATQKLQKENEAPSIVSVITKEDIQRYGHRDLTDILRTVPGFEFGMDVFGIIGL